jgi:hypothetical protein
MGKSETGAEGRCAQSGWAPEGFSQQAGRVVHSGCLRKMGRPGPCGIGRDDKAKAMGIREDRGWPNAAKARNHEQIPEFARC